MNNPVIRSRLQALTGESLAEENRRFTGSGGISANNRQRGFIPAFLDRDTGAVYRSRFPDGRPAPVHMLSGLPDALLETDGQTGNHRHIKSSIISGFILEDAFYTREEAAFKVNAESRIH
ncbi:MAG TPA: hypothetical protein VET88_16140 [Gammaproteobacteria bacterium]|nr:hypothetical protein [Gammaproteobacteria bacterium]